MVTGNSQEMRKVEKWVRGLGPKRRQLPLHHFGPLPEFSTPPSFSLRGVEWTFGEVPLRGCARQFRASNIINITFNLMQKNANVRS